MKKKKKFKRLSRKFEKIENFLKKDEILDTVEHDEFTDESLSKIKLDSVKQNILSSIDCIEGNVECFFNSNELKDFGMDKLKFEIEVAKVINQEISNLNFSPYVQSLSFTINSAPKINNTIEISFLGNLKKVNNLLTAILMKLNKGFTERVAKSKHYLVESLGESSQKLVIIYEYDKDYRIQYLKKLKQQRVQQAKTEKKVVRNYVNGKNEVTKTEIILSVKASENRKKKIIKPSRKSNPQIRRTDRNIEM